MSAMPLAALIAARAAARLRGPGSSCWPPLIVVSAGLGSYHAGVEWGFWLGPSDCGGAAAPAAGKVGDFLTSCRRPAW